MNSNHTKQLNQFCIFVFINFSFITKACQEEKLMSHLGQVLYEYLGEEYPEVLGSILGALKGLSQLFSLTLGTN